MDTDEGVKAWTLAEQLVVQLAMQKQQIALNEIASMSHISTSSFFFFFFPPHQSLNIPRQSSTFHHVIKIQHHQQISIPPSPSSTYAFFLFCYNNFKLKSQFLYYSAVTISLDELTLAVEGASKNVQINKTIAALERNIEKVTKRNNVLLVEKDTAHADVANHVQHIAKLEARAAMLAEKQKKMDEKMQRLENRAALMQKANKMLKSKNEEMKEKLKSFNVAASASPHGGGGGGGLMMTMMMMSSMGDSDGGASMKLSTSLKSLTSSAVEGLTSADGESSPSPLSRKSDDNLEVSPVCGDENALFVDNNNNNDNDNNYNNNNNNDNNNNDNTLMLHRRRAECGGGAEEAQKLLLHLMKVSTDAAKIMGEWGIEGIAGCDTDKDARTLVGYLAMAKKTATPRTITSTTPQVIAPPPPPPEIEEPSPPPPPPPGMGGPSPPPPPPGMGKNN